MGVQTVTLLAWEVNTWPAVQGASFAPPALLQNNQLWFRVKMPEFPKVPLSEVSNHHRIPDGKAGEQPCAFSTREDTEHTQEDQCIQNVV